MSTIESNGAQWSTIEHAYLHAYLLTVLMSIINHTYYYSIDHKDCFGVRTDTYFSNHLQK